jgi:formylglycine-generating enzyme
MKLKTIANLASIALALTMIACSGKKDQANSRPTNGKGFYSSTTGWRYNDRNGTGFTVKNSKVNNIPIGMVAIQGGTFTIGEKGEYVTAPRDNKPRRITVSSFYMDQTEIRNVDWREYTTWMKAVFGKTAPRLVQKAQPDNTVWREELAYNEPYLENYFSNPAYDQYPIVGVTWEQAMDYCQWRTDRQNERALWEAGIILPPDFAKLQKMTSFDSITNNFVFNTQKYLKQDSYQPPVGKNTKKDLYGKNQKVDMSDGILYSDFRLPTEAEWEFAAYAITSNGSGVVKEGKIYPWSGSDLRTQQSNKQLSRMQANFVRGRGDMMGTSGSLNDKGTITLPVNSFPPNDFGLYNMAGNVNEWVLDVYRSTSFDDMAEYNSFRGNVYLTPIVASLDALGNKTYKVDSLGRIANEVAKGDDVRNFKDGDAASQLDYSANDTTGINNLRNNAKLDPTDILRPVISEKTRVYKGGSWKDRAYWLNPSTRRYLNQDKSTNDIGFRCAMSMIGDREQPKKK